MQVRIGEWFELELSRKTLFIRVGRFARFYNSLGMPTH